jgi:hypothetical protein
VSFRAGLGAGQFCFAELLLFCIIYKGTASQWPQGVGLGVSFAKYSFSPVVAFTFLLKRRVLILAISLLPVLGGVVICMAMLHKPLLSLIFEPLLVARHGVSPGFADIMTLGNRLFGPRYAGPIDAGALLLAMLYAIRLARSKRSRGAEFAAVAVASLLLFTHLIYDYLFLLVPLCYAVWGGELKRGARWTVILIIGYVWFGSPLYLGRNAVRSDLAVLLINCLSNIALLVAIDTGQRSAKRSTAEIKAETSQLSFIEVQSEATEAV